jgi:hypothetical protein
VRALPEEQIGSDRGAQFGLGTNMGIKAIADASGHAETERELRHVRRTYITKDNLRQAIVNVVNATFEARNPEW